MTLGSASASIQLSLQSDDGRLLTGAFTALWTISGQTGSATTTGEIVQVFGSAHTFVSPCPNCQSTAPW